MAQELTLLFIGKIQNHIELKSFALGVHTEHMIVIYKSFVPPKTKNVAIHFNFTKNRMCKGAELDVFPKTRFLFLGSSPKELKNHARRNLSHTLGPP